MRFSIQFSTPMIPADYRRAGLSFVKGALAVADKELFRKFYEEEKTRKKPFTFTMNFKGKRQGDVIFPKDEKVFMTFATSSERFASALVSAVAKQIPIEVSLMGQARTIFIPERFNVIKEEFSPNVLIKDFVLPVKFLVKKYPERFKGRPIDEMIRRYINDQGYEFEDMKVKPKTTTYGIEGFKIEKFKCSDLYLFGVKGDLKRLYQEGIGQYKSQGFGFPLPL